MKLKLISWNGHNINDGTSYDAADQTPQLLAKSDAVFVSREDAYEKYSGMEYGHRTMVIGIAILGEFYSLRDQLKAWFEEDRSTPKELLAQDLADGNKQWYATGVCVDLIEEGHIATVVLEMEETFWRQKTASTLSWDVTASPQTQNISVGGNTPAKPILTFTPKQAKSGDYAWKRFVAVLNPTQRAMTDYYLDVSGQTGKQLDTATLTTAKMQAGGQDLRLWLNGKEIYRWLTGMDTAATGVHTAEIPLSAGIVLTLSGSIAISGAVSTITVKSTAENKAALQKLKTVTNKALAIKTGSAIEIFTFTDTTPDQYKITGTTRAQKLTSMIAHSDGDSIYWVEHDCYLLYGNATVSAPEVDDQRKPMQDLTNSTNAAWVWNEFTDDAYARPGAWQKHLLKSVGGLSAHYSADHGGEASPASEMGMKMLAWLLGVVWKSETAILDWTFYDPAGFVSWVLGGEKFRSGSSFPAVASMQKSNDQLKWTTVANEPKPTLPNVWQALTVLTGTKSLSGTFQAIRFLFSGSVSNTPNNMAAIEFDGLTGNKDTANVPLIFVGTETANYMVNELIENLTTGESMAVYYHGALNNPIVIDTEERTVVYGDGSSILGALTRSGEWLSLKPGVTNQIRVTDAGITQVTHKLDWENRGS